MINDLFSQNDTHFMVQYKEVAHPDGWMLEVAKDGRYRPVRGYNHHVHPRPHLAFDSYDHHTHQGDYDYFFEDLPASTGVGAGAGVAAAMPHVGLGQVEFIKLVYQSSKYSFFIAGSRILRNPRQFLLQLRPTIFR